MIFILVPILITVGSNSSIFHLFELTPSPLHSISMVYTLKYTYSYSNGVIQMSDSGIFENANSFTLILQHSSSVVLSSPVSHSKVSIKVNICICLYINTIIYLWKNENDDFLFTNDLLRKLMIQFRYCSYTNISFAKHQ